jgi:hypothetical protein
VPGCGWAAAELRLAFRPADQVALELVAVVVQQEPELLLRLDALGDHAQSEAVRHQDDSRGDRRVVRVCRQVVHKRAVDLQPVDPESLEVAQRGVPRAEVVDGDADAHLADLVQDARRSRVLDGGPLAISSSRY